MREQVAVEQREIVGSRIVPFTGLSITATTSGTAQTFATANGQGAMLVKRLVVSNITGTAAVLNLHAVPDGGSIGNANAQLVGYSVAENTAVDLTEIIGGYYPANTTLEVWSGTSAALTLSGYWEDVF